MIILYVNAYLKQGCLMSVYLNPMVLGILIVESKCLHMELNEIVN